MRENGGQWGGDAGMMAIWENMLAGLHVGGPGTCNTSQFQGDTLRDHLTTDAHEQAVWDADCMK